MYVREPTGPARVSVCACRAEVRARYAPALSRKKGRVSILFWHGRASVDVLFWPRASVTLSNEYQEQRNPMFVFVFDGALFRFNVNTPVFEPLFQFPPRMKARAASRRGPAPGSAKARKKPNASSIRRASSRSRLRARRRRHTVARL